MDMDTSAPAPGADAASSYGARVIGVIDLLLGIVEVGFAVVLWADAADTTGDSAMFAGIGYLLALVIGVPGVIALLLGAGGLAIGRNPTAAYVIGCAGLLAALAPLLLFLNLYI